MMTVGDVFAHKLNSLIDKKAKEQPKKYWYGSVREFDDFEDRIDNIFIDGKTEFGPWAIMTPKNHRIYGCGLGLGKGQKYIKTMNGKWLKSEG